MMIELKEVSKIYGTVEHRIPAVVKASLTVNTGEFVVITGPSGSGKTTLLNLIGGMTWPDEGKVLLDGKDLRQLPDRELSRFRGQEIGFMFQFQSMLPSLSALDNVRLPLYFAGLRDDPNLAGQILADVGLADRVHAFSHELSAGQQRRVCLARALITQPRLLLCDEPTGDLDPETENLIMKKIKEANQKGATVLVTTHNPALSAYASLRFKIETGIITLEE